MLQDIQPNWVCREIRMISCAFGGILSTDDNPLQILKIAYEAVTPTGYIIAGTE